MLKEDVRRIYKLYKNKEKQLIISHVKEFINEF